MYRRRGESAPWLWSQSCLDRSGPSSVHKKKNIITLEQRETNNATSPKWELIFLIATKVYNSSCGHRERVTHKTQPPRLSPERKATPLTLLLYNYYAWKSWSHQTMKMVNSSILENFTWKETYLANILTRCSSPPQGDAVGWAWPTGLHL